MNLPKETIYFDTETLSLNPYSFEAKLIATQIGTCINGYFESEICCEWNNITGEINLIEGINKRFNILPKYTPVFTYNGLFDIFYILGRCHVLKLDNIYSSLLQRFMDGFKHCDMMQFDNGYYVSMDRVCKAYNIIADSPYSGKDIKDLYDRKDYKNIIAHGKDDIKRLYRLVNETDLADRYYK
jgi:hypothetical protein